MPCRLQTRWAAATHPCWYVQLIMALGTSKPSGPAGRGGQRGNDRTREGAYGGQPTRFAAVLPQLCQAQHAEQRTRHGMGTAQRTAERGPQVGCLCCAVLVLLQVLPKCPQEGIL